jgi:hypothetical protein
MFIQQVVHIKLSMPLHKSTRSFQFIYTCHNKIKHLYYYHKKIQGLFSNSTKIHCKSLVDKYINRNERLNDFCLVEFVANYDTKVNKRRNKTKIICWVSFNQHKNSKNHYR